MRSVKIGTVSALVLVLGALIVVLFCLFCARPVAVTYRAVSSDGPGAEVDDICWGEESYLLIPADRIIRNGKLYLRVKLQRNWVVRMSVADDNWDAQRVHTFRSAHPELEAYWPDADRPDGGVKWLTAKSP